MTFVSFAISSENLNHLRAKCMFFFSCAVLIILLTCRQWLKISWYVGIASSVDYHLYFSLFACYDYVPLDQLFLTCKIQIAGWISRSRVRKHLD